MMEGKAVIVFDSQKYKYHTFAAALAGNYITARHEPVYADLGRAGEQEAKAFLQQQEPALLITLDCVGFELELMGGDLFYNSLCCPAAHLLFDNPVNHAEALNKRMNFTMDFWTVRQDYISYIKENHERVHDCFLLPTDKIMPFEGTSQLNRPLDIITASDYIPSSLCEDEGLRAKMSDIERVTRALSEDGIPLYVCGSGWEKLHALGINVLSRECDDAGLFFEVAKQSKLVLDFKADCPEGCGLSCMAAKFAGAGVISVAGDSVEALYAQIAEKIQ